ncbi:hypothetical protein [Ammoniphilus resinae]|uniref:RNA-binding Zn-ribbon protein involved in translation (DUF1610 family) n=1 Tax=Ammoniphilus resinae TaxID=861532 RepID=A0ABS4GNQ2_9BACL|nr:hypothetical protein [Ammoniphilus resinae]MBP1931861.1 putative RNA-binding Zn-ribbon protein involved in translation (DUF1610 family) [Ammoniphilus resinae]
MNVQEVKKFNVMANEHNKKRQLAYFYEAELNAFDKAGIAFGKVSFSCPICGGEAISRRLLTPNHPTYSMTMQGSCGSCGFSHLSGVR